MLTYLTEVFWQCFPSSCYHLQKIKIKSTYLNAAAYCNGIGGHLLALESQQEMVDIKDILDAPAGRLFTHLAILVFNCESIKTV